MTVRAPAGLGLMLAVLAAARTKAASARRSFAGDTITEAGVVRHASSHWKLGWERSSMTDSVTISAGLFSDSMLSSALTPVKVWPAIALTCESGQISAMLIVDKDILRSDLDNRTSVRLRWDDEPARSASWLAPMSGGGALISNPQAFVREGLARHHRLQLELSLYSQGPQVARFQIPPIDSALAALRRGCPRAGL